MHRDNTTYKAFESDGIRYPRYRICHAGELKKPHNLHASDDVKHHLHQKLRVAALGICKGMVYISIDHDLHIHSYLGRQRAGYAIASDLPYIVLVEHNPFHCWRLLQDPLHHLTGNKTLRRRPLRRTSLRFSHQKSSRRRHCHRENHASDIRTLEYCRKLLSKYVRSFSDSIKFL